MKRFALCLSNDFGDDFFDADMSPGLVYETLGEERGALLIVDESGDDFLYPAKHFLRLNDAQSVQLAQGLILGGVQSCCTLNVDGVILSSRRCMTSAHNCSKSRAVTCMGFRKRQRLVLWRLAFDSPRSTPPNKKTLQSCPSGYQPLR